MSRIIETQEFNDYHEVKNLSTNTLNREQNNIIDADALQELRARVHAQQNRMKTARQSPIIEVD